MTPVGLVTALLVTGVDAGSLLPLAQAGGSDSEGISGVALWVGLLVLLVIFLAIIMRAFGQRRGAHPEQEALPEPEEAEAEAEVPEAAERKPSLKEIKEERAKKLAGGPSDKDTLLKARQARKGASRVAIEEAQAEADETEPTTKAPALDAAKPKATQEEAGTEPSRAKAPKETAAASAVDVKPAEVPEPKKAEPKRPEPAKPTKTLREGLAKTRSGFFGRLKGLFSREKAIDAELMGELEEVLLTADIGVKTSMKLLELVESEVTKNGEVSADQVWELMRSLTAGILGSVQRPLVIGEARPFVILVIGVNGVGKTTTIGKLGSRLKSEGHKVLLVAGDTFRAAAIDQLEIWGERTGCEVFAGPERADPSGVVFDGLKRATEIEADVVLVDTAGRLHTKVNLVQELAKVSRVSGKALAGAPHEVLLVLDANTGQNAINQAEMFGKEVGVTGIALTKLDGTAKGGVVIGICDELGVPVQFIGIGEQVEDLRVFDAEEFVEAVF